MTDRLPTNRTSSNTIAEHVADHNTLHKQYNAKLDHTSDQPASAGSFDEEMDSALAGAWTWVTNSGTPTVDDTFANWVDTNPTNPRYSQGVYLPDYLILQPKASFMEKVYRAVPTGFGAATKWVIGAKLKLLNSAGTDDRVSFSLVKETPSSTADEPTDGIHTHIRNNGGSSQIRVYGKNGGAVTGEQDTGTALACYTMYVAFAQLTGNDLYVYACDDGMGWERFTIISGKNINANVNYIAIAIGDGNNSGTPCIGLVDWVRFRTGTTDPNALFLT